MLVTCTHSKPGMLLQAPVSPMTPLGIPTAPLLATLSWEGAHAALVFDGSDLNSLEAGLGKVGSHCHCSVLCKNP